MNGPAEKMIWRMVNRVVAATLIAVGLFASPAAASTHKKPSAAVSTRQLAMFDTEAGAQRHCPRDIVVWLNTNTGIYHEQGMRWYGRTKHGAYVCRQEADAVGDRDTRNGQ
jgi:hypothetical protein